MNPETFEIKIFRSLLGNCLCKSDLQVIFGSNESVDINPYQVAHWGISQTAKQFLIEVLIEYAFDKGYSEGIRDQKL
jgi:hypothetical protein